MHFDQIFVASILFTVGTARLEFYFHLGLSDLPVLHNIRVRNELFSRPVEIMKILFGLA